MPWNIDEEYWPGPYEQPTGWEVCRDAFRNLGKSLDTTTNRITLFPSGFDMKYVPAKPPKRKTNQGPRPKNTFDKRGRRRY